MISVCYIHCVFNIIVNYNRYFLTWSQSIICSILVTGDRLNDCPQSVITKNALSETRELDSAQEDTSLTFRSALDKFNVTHIKTNRSTWQLSVGGPNHINQSLGFIQVSLPAEVTNGGLDLNHNQCDYSRVSPQTLHASQCSGIPFPTHVPFPFSQSLL